MNNAIIDAACISTQNECVKKKKKKSIMNFSESRKNRFRENREKSKNLFFFHPPYRTPTKKHTYCAPTTKTHTHTTRYTHRHTHTAIHTHRHTHTHTDTHTHTLTHTHT